MTVQGHLVGPPAFTTADLSARHAIPAGDLEQWLRGLAAEGTVALTAGRWHFTHDGDRSLGAALRALEPTEEDGYVEIES